MERNIIRSLIVLAIGVAMALAAYAGQSGYRDDQPIGSGGLLKSIRSSVVQGHRFDYRLAYRQEDGPASEAELLGASSGKSTSGPELMLFLSDPAGDLVYSAEVKYTVTGPRGTQIKARALPMEGGYAAGIYCSRRGLYQVQAEVVTSGLDLVDSFVYEVM